ncbi:MAG: hypothetical protein JOZ57_07685, partial [Abitibacteriaceae bacterium]|nr:hypothetical protein [Abditibacteriaceae bacterium]
MKFRYLGIPLFIAIWAIVFSVPRLRVMWQAQVFGSTYMLYPWTHLFQTDKFSTDELVQQYPNDVQVLATDADKKDGRLRTRAYDNLIQRFPNQAWLIASRLRYTTTWLNDDRLAGAFESPTRFPRGTTVAPERSAKPPTFSPEELQQAIVLARRGRQLEPDNCFFDWMLATLLYSGYHDAEALQVLHEGSVKPRYEDHSYDNAQAAMAAYEKSRPLLIEEKIALSAMIAFPEYARLRHFARLLSWDAWKSESAGD